jgi:hypothetical protein
MSDEKLALFLMDNAGLEFCDECLADELGVSVPQARDGRLALRSRERFEQHVGLCAGCQRNRLVVGSPIV